jgi:hypothetical protein
MKASLGFNSSLANMKAAGVSEEGLRAAVLRMLGQVCTLKTPSSRCAHPTCSLCAGEGRLYESADAARARLAGAGVQQ